VFENYPLAYCLNVHPTLDVEDFFANIETRATSVLAQSKYADRLGLGLWIPADVTGEILQPKNIERLKGICDSCGFAPFTFNGFPFGNFHQPVVKHDVYKPTWANKARLEYTTQLVDIMHSLLAPRLEGSISTLPLGWPTETPDQKTSDEFFSQSAQHLIQCCNYLSKLEKETGRLIYVCIEPEPGCILDSADDVCGFFDQWLLSGKSTDQQTEILRYLRVCHDVCHSAVVNEPQDVAIRRYNECGLSVGKVQISSAPTIDFSKLAENQKVAALQEIGSYAEPKYLHQTSIDGTLFEDLHLASEHGADRAFGKWIVHFHVPIFAEHLSLVSTTQGEIRKAWNALKNESDVQHFEVETYAWNVLPNRDQFANLETGIALEIDWFLENIANSP